MADRTVSVSLVARVQGFTAGIATAQKSLSEFDAKLQAMGKKSPEKFNELTTGIGAAGLALTGLAGYAVHAAMAFDKQMSEVGAVSGATGQQMQTLRQAALDAGKATQFSATQAAQAEGELAKAGVSTADILGGALRGSMDLAAAGGLDLADSATLAAQAMNVFQLHGKDVGHIADVLAAGANKSAADVKGLGDALRQGGQVAAQTGLSLEDTVGTLSAFADRALIGSDAGTSLKTMLQRLSNPSNEASALMQQLGIHTYDAAGQFVGITDIAGQLQTQLGDLTQAERDQALATIFGSDAVRAANVLYGLGSDGLRKYITAVNDAGAAQDMAKAKMDNLSGDVEQLRGSIETLAITSGTGANSGLRDLAQALTGVVNGFMNLPGPVQETLTVLTGVSGVALLGASGFLKLRQQGTQVLDALREMGPLGSKAAGGLGKLAGIATTLGLTLAALQTYSAVVGHDIDPSIKATMDDLVKFGQTGKKTGEAMAQLDYDLKSLGTGAMAKFGNGLAGTIEGLTGLGRVADQSLYHAQQRIGSIDQAMAALVSAGRTDEAAAAFKRLSDAGKKAGISVDDLKKGLPQYEAALAGADKTQLNAIQHEQEQSLQMRILKGGIDSAINAYGSLAAAVDAFNGKAVDSERATIAAKDAEDRFTQSLRDNKLTFDDNTPAGRANMSALLDVADAAKQAAQFRYQETGSVAEATKVYNGYKNQLVDTLVKMGMSRQAALALANQYMKIPSEISTSVLTPGMQQAISQAKTLDSLLHGLDRTVYARVVTTYYANHPENQYNGRAGVNVAQRWGGVVAARDGLLNAGTVNQPTVLFGERQTGGEAFVPRFGDAGRSLATLATAAGWYGATLTRGAATYNVYVTVPYGAHPSEAGRQVVEVIRAYEQRSGNSWRR